MDAYQLKIIRTHKPRPFGSCYTHHLMLTIFTLLIWVLPAGAQSRYEDDRVMLQGFYWESYRHGHPEKFPTFGDKPWYQIVHEHAFSAPGA